MPEHDRESGSRRLFHFIECLLEAGWAVSFLAENATGGDRYARMLRQLGVATYAGPETRFAGPEYLPDPGSLLVAGRFDIVILVFWHIAEKYTPLVRSLSPTARVVVDSVDLHFLRKARAALRASPLTGRPGVLDSRYADEARRELNAYAGADAVLTVSQKEADLVNDFTGNPRLACVVPDGEDERVWALSPLRFVERRGVLFVGNFRHPPNVEAVEYLCDCVLPLLPPEALREHPIYVVGTEVNMVSSKVGDSHPGIRWVGWVPSVLPYLQRVRVSVVPLLSGAGTKRKVIQSLMVGTPTVSTSIGAEGLDLSDGEHALIADDPLAFASAISKVLSDERLWERLAKQGRAHILSKHSREAVRDRFLRFLTTVVRVGSEVGPSQKGSCAD